MHILRSKMRIHEKVENIAGAIKQCGNNDLVNEGSKINHFNMH